MEQVNDDRLVQTRTNVEFQTENYAETSNQESPIVPAVERDPYTSPFDSRSSREYEEEGLTEQEQAQLDDETLELLEDMTKQEAELEAILSRHKEDAAELTSIRDAMIKELEMLKQEAWKLEAMHELTDMTSQLDGLLQRGSIDGKTTCPDTHDAGSVSSGDTSADGLGHQSAEISQHELSRQEINAHVSALLDAEEAVLDEELDVLRTQLADIKLQAAEMDKRRDALMQELAEFEMPDRWDADEAE